MNKFEKQKMRIFLNAMSPKVAKGDSTIPENEYHDTESAHIETLRDFRLGPVRTCTLNNLERNSENFCPTVIFNLNLNL